jgi:hippurate hydrolase
MFNRLMGLAALLALCVSVGATELNDAVKRDYDDYLWPLFDHFHRNPELSTIENDTAARMAEELRGAGFEVTEGVGGTGVVAMMKNGDGPLVMMRADMDGLPVEEKSGLENASRKTQIDPITGNEVFTMHACGHDVHITSLVGTARQMAERKDSWSGTLMLVVQPAEERVLGAAAMKADKIWDRFGQPDYALAFHVSSNDVAGVKGLLTREPIRSTSSSTGSVRTAHIRIEVETRLCLAVRLFSHCRPWWHGSCHRANPAWLRSVPSMPVPSTTSFPIVHICS